MHESDVRLHYPMKNIGTHGPALAQQFTQECRRLNCLVSREIPSQNGPSETINKSIQHTWQDMRLLSLDSEER